MTVTKSRFATGELNSPQPSDGSIWFVPFDIVMPTAAPVALDLFELIHLPPGVSIVDFDIYAPQLDSNGTPTLAFSLGTEDATLIALATTFETGLTFGRTANGSVSRMTFGGAPGIDQLAAAATLTNRRIALSVSTIAATWAGAGKIVTAILGLRG